MAKIDRYNGNLEAPASAALGTERTIFGTSSQSDDLTDQFNAFLLRGWGIVGPSDQPTLQDFNAMGFTLGQIHAYLHQMGVAEYNATQEYHTGSIANVAGVLYVSLVDDNVGNAPASSPSQWRDANMLDSTRIDVASATTVDLTTAAPNTRHINITGTTTITGFTVTVGKTYFVRFVGALTLTNSASLVTQSGANILTASGDTCIIRATAANVVEVLCYTRAADSYDTGWISPTLQNSYTAESGNEIKYRKIGKTVYIAGGVRRASAIAGAQTIFTLPAGFRPEHSGQLGAGVWVYDAIGTQLMTINVTTGGLFNTGAITTLGGNVTGAGGASFLYSFIVP